MDHGCCITNDDRTRLSSDPADPHSGRYSLKIHIPTRVPLWIPIPLLTKHAPGPLQNSTTYRYVYTHIIGYALTNVMTEWFFLLPADDILLLELLWALLWALLLQFDGLGPQLSDRCWYLLHLWCDGEHDRHCRPDAARHCDTRLDEA